MGIKSLKAGIGLIRHPVLWVAPVVCAVFAALQIYLAFGESGLFFGEKIGLIWFFVIPFLLAGTYGCIRNDSYSPSSYMRTGAAGYFRVLLPLVLLTFIGLVLFFIASVPAVAGGTLLTFLLLVVFFIPFIYLTFFFDTAAVFENKRVFESIKRSYEVASLRTAETIGFFAVLILLMFIIFFGIMIVWSGLMVDQLTPLVNMSDSELAALASDPEAFVALIGEWGVVATSLIYAAGTFITVIIVLPYKAVFYRDVTAGLVAGPASPPEIGGEYDEKGRWYKYS